MPTPQQLANQIQAGTTALRNRVVELIELLQSVPGGRSGCDCVIVDGELRSLCDLHQARERDAEDRGRAEGYANGRADGIAALRARAAQIRALASAAEE